MGTGVGRRKAFCTSESPEIPKLEMDDSSNKVGYAGGFQCVY